jgi:hypothetical protein
MQIFILLYALVFNILLLFYVNVNVLQYYMLAVWLVFII